MEPQQTYWQPAPQEQWQPAPPPVVVRTDRFGLYAMVVITLLLTLVDTAMIIYIFRVAYGIAHIGDEVTRALIGD